MVSFFSRASVRKAVRSWRGVLLGSILTLSFAGCGDSKGSECALCTTDDECVASGLVCVPFGDGSKRCGSGNGSTQCRKPLF
jgi:hypothetical protein